MNIKFKDPERIRLKLQAKHRYDLARFKANNDLKAVFKRTLIRNYGGQDGCQNKYRRLLLGSGLPVVLDYLALDDRCRSSKTDSGQLEAV
jgi:hypothetical protein